MRNRALGTAVALVVFVPLSVLGVIWLQDRARHARVEEQVRGFAQSRETVLYTSDPQVLERILRDDSLAGRLESLRLSGVDLAHQDWSALARLPNLKHLQVYGGPGDDLVPLLNQAPGIHTVSLLESGLSEAGLDSLDAPILRRFESHQYLPRIADAAVDRARQRMPNCEFSLTWEE